MLEIPPNPSIKVGDIIDIDVQDVQGVPHYTRGKYIIYKHVVHVRKGSYKQYVYFQRRTAERSG